jgi:hypothetical protein
LVEILRAAEFVAEEAAAAVARVAVEVGRVVEAEEVAAELEQEPKAGLHPDPQYAFDEPQYPYL